jgi:hypothetical protein
MPALAKDHCTRPEQSKAFGPGEELPGVAGDHDLTQELDPDVATEDRRHLTAQGEWVGLRGGDQDPRVWDQTDLAGPRVVDHGVHTGHPDRGEGPDPQRVGGARVDRDGLAEGQPGVVTHVERRGQLTPSDALPERVAASGQRRGPGPELRRGDPDHEPWMVVDRGVPGGDPLGPAYPGQSVQCGGLVPGQSVPGRDQQSPVHQPLGAV